MTTCHQDICPHMHFNKCYAERIRSIPVSIFPDPTIDSFTNVNVKCGKHFKSNISTVAYEKYNFSHEAREEERNFVKDFYMENFQKDKIVFNNNIVDELKQDMNKKSAYVLAEGATKDHEAFEENRKMALENARYRANSAFKSHFNNLKEQKQKNHEENGYWLKKLYRKLEEVAKHIIQGTGQDEGERQKQFLLSKQSLTANFLAQIKIKDPKCAHDILEELRILMQKKKLRFSDQREEQQLNQSVTQSFTSSVSQNTTQNSILSQITSLHQANVFGEDQLVEKYWNFNDLKKKWNLDDVQNVKEMIRRVLARKVIFDAEIEAARKNREAKQLNKKLIKMETESSKNLKSHQKPAQSMKKRAPSETKTKVQNVIEKKIVQTVRKLTKQEQAAKKKLIQGGKYDAIGQKFLRNKTYSQIFKNKLNEIKTILVQKQPIQTVHSKESKLLKSTNISLQK